MASEREEIVRVLRVHLARQEWDEAIVGLNKLIKLSPQNLKLHLRLAQLYSKVGETHKALGGFQHCAEGFYKGKRYGEALAAATSILELQSGSRFALEMVRDAKGKLASVRKELMNTLKRDLLASLPTEGLGELASYVQLATYPGGAAIVKEGDPGVNLFIIRRGEVEVYLTDQQGKRFKLAALQKGDFFAEISLLTGERRTATVEATDQCDLWVLGKQDFDRLITKYPGFGKVIRLHSRQRTKDTAQQMRARRITRRKHPRVRVKLRVDAVMLDEGGSPLATAAAISWLDDISLGGARLRVPLSNPEQWAQLKKVRQVRLSLEPEMSITCYVRRAVQEERGQRVHAVLGLAFGDLSTFQMEQVTSFVTWQQLDEPVDALFVP